MNPLPDYWLAVLHKRLMGQVVLNATSESRGLRVYAHCALGRGVGLSFLNRDETRADGQLGGTDSWEELCM